MGIFDGRRIVLGVTGGIAAYKAVEVCRRLVDAGAHVSPILTKGAEKFIGRATFDALASEKVQTSLWEEEHPIPHTNLGQNADLILVCPATARLLSDYRTGRSADLLTATLLATRAPVIVCPAMHTEMWEQPSVQENIQELIKRGVEIVGPDQGRLAGGDDGAGRLSDPVSVVAAVEKVLNLGLNSKTQDFLGLQVLVSAGGTKEPICPVRYIGNRSSGKQGHAIALEAATRGASVVCVTTEPSHAPNHPNLKVVTVETADEMAQTVFSEAPKSDLVVMAAAVADFTPVVKSEKKIKKSEECLEIRLEPTVDILAALGSSHTGKQILVGFAAETNDLEENAKKKLEAKGIDLIVANDVSAENTGFNCDTNAVTLFDLVGRKTEFPLADKRDIAQAILDTALKLKVDRHEEIGEK
ncbi:MAG: phosphopantothenoylcysteine decarboxylase [marine actinobacterium MedAcidi-G2B]|nr:MAG: phosphopantothenoylcysteine decarboxylase [marine actinobacterium MedAcidi-G2B]MAU49968.1 bifunctional phosphopantothenoylcysteine decarboxylase/phosphopantothenate--cysteine ligase CoaBC [Actinomycetota bacterium]MDC0245618.1 bifunctional phosphopantothenoylcysteine decarboxylase/phosphopantothenate--cysteine ligase CoaBC [Acidimicrobiaceae bacterium]|tara:strand:- start:2137 stop:3378 length:1242 start_codon:yes stop_codon:yes gene_type:complete